MQVIRLITIGCRVKHIIKAERCGYKIRPVMTKRFALAEYLELERVKQVRGFSNGD